MRKAFVDLDGTLINSKARHISVLQKVLDLFSLEKFSVEKFVQYKSNGFSTKNYLSNELQIDDALSEKIFLQWVKLVESEEEINKDIWYEDALSFLTYLKENRYWIVAVSARKNKEGLLRFIERSQVSDLLDEIIVVSPMNAKADKEKYVIEHLGKINIVVGDTENDQIDDTRIRCFLLNRGFRSKEYWEERNIRSFDSLSKVILEIEKKSKYQDEKI